MPEISNNIRTKLIECYITSMQGDVEKAVNSIDIETKAPSLKKLDLIALFMLKAKIYYLVGDYEKSLNVFNHNIEPILKHIPDEKAIIIMRNRNHVSLANFEKDAVISSYNTYDRANVMRHIDTDYAQLLDAKEKAEQNKHYDSLHLLWSLLIESFASCSWYAFEDMSKEMFKECLSLGWLSQAAYHMIHSRGQSLVGDLASRILLLPSCEQIEKVIECIVCNANMAGHAMVGLDFLTKVSDYIPDGYIGVIFGYSSQFVNYGGNNNLKNQVAIRAWKLIQQIGVRLSKAQATQVVRMAIGHEMWGIHHVHRQELIKAVNCVIQPLPKAEYDSLITEAIKIATVLKSDTDYVDAINLLCHIASNANKVHKKKIINGLYPKDAVEINITLARATKHFDKKIIIEDKSAIINRIAKSIKLQVQRLKKGDNPEKVNGMFFSISQENKNTDEKVVVYCVSDSDMNFFAENIEQFENVNIDKVINVAIDMLSDKDNIISNKIILAKMLSSIGNMISANKKKKIYLILERFALGDIPPGRFAFENSDNPLNPIKINDNKPNSLSGYALYALACLEKSEPGIYGGKIYDLIEKSLVHTDPVIRQWSFAGVKELPDITDKLLMGLIWGTNDRDINTALLSFDTLTRLESFAPNDIHWKYLSFSILNSINIYNSSLRRTIGMFLKKYKDAIPSEYKKDFNGTIKSMKNDLAYSVRSVFLNNKINR